MPHMTHRWLCVLLITYTLGYSAQLTRAASQVSNTADSYDVFASSSTATSKSSVYFMDARTGLSTIAATNGDNPTLLGNTVIFVDHQTGKVGMASPDGSVASQPFMLAADAASDTVVIWAVSANRNWITWAAAHSAAGSLLTDLYVAGADGSSKQLILHTSSSKAVGVRPLAISDDGASVFYTRQADDPKGTHVYPYAADIFRLSVATDVPSQPNGEPRCACTAAFSADGRLFFRLETNLTAHFSDLSVNADSSLTPPITAFTQAGDALFADQGNAAIYSVAKGSQPEQYALVLADAAQHQQRVIVPPSANHLRPVAFAGGVVILAGVDKDGTYKLWLSDGTLTQVSAYTYLGTINHW